MKLRITDEYELNEDEEIETNEVDRNAMGGTELMKYGLYERVPKEALEPFQIICSRYRGTKKGKKPIYWLHDLPDDPESQHLRGDGWAKFEKIVCVSNWQMQQYHDKLGLPYHRSTVVMNAIDPFTEDEITRADEDDTIRLIYHSTPHRGLNILIPVFEHLAQQYENIELDIFSSFELYGWKERDEQYKELFEKAEAHPKINYHGSQPNDVVRKALGKAHIFAYPSIWPETSCMCLMEAMSAGLLCVHPNYAALPETAANWTYMYQWNEDLNTHANMFARHLAECIQLYNTDAMQQRLKMQKMYADSFYSWESRALQWEMMLSRMNDTKTT